MLSWAQVDTELLAMELEWLADASAVETSLWEASLRGAVPLISGPGFYVHSFELYRTEHVDKVLSLSESAWSTFEPEFGVQVAGVWRNLQSATATIAGLRPRLHRTWPSFRRGLILVAGVVGMVVSGVVFGASKQKLRVSCSEGRCAIQHKAGFLNSGP